MKLTYTNVNGYLIPNLTYKSGEQMEQLGKYGFLRRDYLKNHRNSTYQVMLLQDTIGEHLLEVDKCDMNRIADTLRKELPEYAVPGEINIIEKMPVTQSGKVDYRALEYMQ